MTVPYNMDVAKVSSFSWLKLFMRWRGSIWKSVFSELGIWLILYYCVMFVYRSDIFLSTRDQELFELLAHHINERLSRIPLTFMLGFFVTQVVDRWRQILSNLGWIEKCALSQPHAFSAALTVNSLIRGHTERIVLIRRSIVRYLVLSQVLVFRDIATSVRRRFPTMRSIVQAGFLLEHELKLFEEVKLDEKYNKYWIPINWACALVFKLKEGAPPNGDVNVHALPHVSHVNYLLNEFKFFRNSLQTLCNFDWVPIPLAYPQVVFMAVRVYFCICLVSRQFIINKATVEQAKVDMYFPMMTVFEFLFIVGWMKVAEVLMNPLGEDDDDFECNFCIDKNIAIGLAIVDQHDTHPELMMDMFKDSQGPIYSEDSQLHGNNNILIGSAAAKSASFVVACLSALFRVPEDSEIKMVQIPPSNRVTPAPSMESLPFANSAIGLRLRKLKESLRQHRTRRSQSVMSSPVSTPVAPADSVSRLNSMTGEENRFFDLSFCEPPCPRDRAQRPRKSPTTSSSRSTKRRRLSESRLAAPC